MWKKIATATGYYGGDELVSERAAMLTSDELSQAERLIEEWKPDPTECDVATSAVSDKEKWP